MIVSETINKSTNVPFYIPSLQRAVKGWIWCVSPPLSFKNLWETVCMIKKIGMFEKYAHTT